MGESHDSFKQECNRLEAVVSIGAALIAVIVLGCFITFINTHFTG